MYFLHYTKLLYFVQYIIDHSNEEVEELNLQLAEMIESINPEKLRPFKVVPLSLPTLASPAAGQEKELVCRVSVDNHTPDTDVEDVAQFQQQLRAYVEHVNTSVLVIKQIFDSLGVKTGRLKLRPVVIEFFSTERPDLKLKMR